MKRWLDSLVARGSLELAGTQYRSPKPLSEPELASLWRDAERSFADNLPLLAYFRHCTDLAGDVLTGRESPLETLFPGGSFELAQALYEQSTTMRYVNGLAAAAFEELALGVPAGRALLCSRWVQGPAAPPARCCPCCPRAHPVPVQRRVGHLPRPAVRLISQSNGSDGNVSINVPADVLQQLAGKSSTIAITLQSTSDEPTQITVECDFQSLGDCARHRFSVTRQKSDVLLQVRFDRSLAPNSAGSLMINSDVDGKARGINLYAVRILPGQ